MIDRTYIKRIKYRARNIADCVTVRFVRVAKTKICLNDGHDITNVCEIGAHDVLTYEALMNKLCCISTRNLQRTTNQLTTPF